jgi:hypothetical protein
MWGTALCAWPTPHSSYLVRQSRYGATKPRHSGCDVGKCAKHLIYTTLPIWRGSATPWIGDVMWGTVLCAWPTPHSPCLARQSRPMDRRYDVGNCALRLAHITPSMVRQSRTIEGVMWENARST